MGKTIIRGATRRRSMPAGGIAAAMGIAAAAEAQSLEKSAVEYRRRSDAVEACRACSFFRSEPGRAVGNCTMVIGAVAADAWCAIWTPATEPSTADAH